MRGSRADAAGCWHPCTPLAAALLLPPVSVLRLATVSPSYTCTAPRSSKGCGGAHHACGDGDDACQRRLVASLQPRYARFLRTTREPCRCLQVVSDVEQPAYPLDRIGVRGVAAGGPGRSRRFVIHPYLMPPAMRLRLCLLCMGMPCMRAMCLGTVAQGLGVTPNMTARTS